jgi:hypothetical protein
LLLSKGANAKLLDASGQNAAWWAQFEGNRAFLRLEGVGAAFAMTRSFSPFISLCLLPSPIALTFPSLLFPSLFLHSSLPLSSLPSLSLLPPSLLSLLSPHSPSLSPFLHPLSPSSSLSSLSSLSPLRECKVALKLKLLRRKLDKMQACGMICKTNIVGKTSVWKEKMKEYEKVVKELKKRDKDLREGSGKGGALPAGLFDSEKHSAYRPDELESIMTKYRKLV